MAYIKADKLNFDPRPQMGEIITEEFYQWLKYITKDKALLAKALEHTFDLTLTYVAVKGSKIIAIATCTTGSIMPLKFNKQYLCQVLGLIRGQSAYTMAKKYMAEYASKTPANTGVITITKQNLTPQEVDNFVAFIKGRESFSTYEVNPLYYTYHE